MFFVSETTARIATTLTDILSMFADFKKNNL
jgi:hypothetical protein